MTRRCIAEKAVSILALSEEVLTFRGEQIVQVVTSTRGALVDMDEGLILSLVVVYRRSSSIVWSRASELSTHTWLPEQLYRPVASEVCS